MPDILSQHLYWLFLISKNLTKLFIYYCINGVMVLYYKRVTFMAYFLKKSVTVQNPLGELINFCTKQRIFKTCFAILFR